MPRNQRSLAAITVVLASMAGLLACPQLLSDDFGAIPATGDDTCARRLTCAGAGGESGESGAAGMGGTASGAGGSGSSAGGSSAGGASAAGASSGEAGSGQGGSGDAGASSGEAGNAGAGSDSPDASVDPPDPDPEPACWLIGLEDSTHSASDNCLGINGWNDVTNGAGSSVNNSSYEDDRVCFTGTVDAGDWGAVYNLTLNDTNPWNAVAAAIGGFQFEAEGEILPPQIQVKYTDASSGDYCRIITPAAAVEVPFASAHPGCSTTSSSVTDAVDLTFIRLVFPPEESDYAIDFCLGIRAIP